MGRPNEGGHIRKFPRHNTYYRLISVNVNGVRRQRFEHRLVMEEHLGRSLLKSEIVHHKDGNGLNNSIDNLEVMTQSEHQNKHLMNKLKWDINDAQNLRSKGWTFEEIAQKYNVTYASIVKAFQRRGIRTTKTKTNKLGWDIDVAKKMFKSGATSYDVAKVMGVSRIAIRDAFKARGIWDDRKG